MDKIIKTIAELLKKYFFHTSYASAQKLWKSKHKNYKENHYMINLCNEAKLV